MTDTNPNLSIWLSNQSTDPTRTKPYKGRGGFEGTAINATYQFYRATETFGPAGKGWGWDVESDENIRNGEEILNVIRIRFWYREPETLEVCSFPVYGQTMLCSKGKDGSARFDEEAPKKSLTDALTKALSFLGFSADVYLGLFDDNKYVNQVKAETGAGPSSLPSVRQKVVDASGVRQEIVSRIKLVLDSPSPLAGLRPILEASRKKAEELGVAVPDACGADPEDLANLIFEISRRLDAARAKV